MVKEWEINGFLFAKGYIWLAVIIATIFFLLKHYTITFPLVQSLTCEKVRCKLYEIILIWLLDNADTSRDVVWYKCTSSI